jgi:hypothetical protein
MTKKISDGERFHWLVNNISYRTANTLSGATAQSQRGQTITMAPSLREASLDRNGNSFYDLIHDEPGQLARFGKLIFAPNEAPADLSPWTPQTYEEDAAREAQRARVNLMPDGSEKVAALAEIRKTFRAASTQQSYFHAGDDIRNQMKARDARV